MAPLGVFLDHRAALSSWSKMKVVVVVVCFLFSCLASLAAAAPFTAAVRDAAGRVADGVGGVVSAKVGAAQQVADRVTGAVEGAVDAKVDAARQVAGRVTGAVEDAVGAKVDAARRAADRVGEVASAKMEAARHVAASVGGAFAASKATVGDAVEQIRAEEKAARVAEAVREFYAGLEERMTVYFKERVL